MAACLLASDLRVMMVTTVVSRRSLVGGDRFRNRITQRGE
jgi:hypothetical protein